MIHLINELQSSPIGYQAITLFLVGYGAFLSVKAQEKKKDD